MTNADKMQRILTKHQLTIEELEVIYNHEIIALWQTACLHLIGKLKLDEMLLTSVSVKAMVKDDIIMVEKNLKALKGLETLMDLKLNEFCLN
jgi:hypothetical protein